MLIAETLFGTVDRVQIAIDRLRQFEPSEGYYLAFSGGKDSQTIYHLALEAGVKFDAHYNLTTVDPPELVRFIKSNYPDAIVERPKKTMWQLIVEKRMPPTRLARYCCETLKEGGGEGRFVITGVRWAESSKRKNTRGVLEILGKRQTKDKIIFLNSDNDEARRMMETCVTKGKRVINPIVDWEDSDVWNYLNSRKINHCCLYDEGFTRIGCIGCPMAQKKGKLKEFERWPKYYDAYYRAAERIVKIQIERLGIEKVHFKTAKELMDWWIYEMKDDPNQEKLFDEE